MNTQNRLVFRAVLWINGLIRRYRASWNGLTVMVMSEDSPRAPRSHRVNYLIILFFAGILVLLPVASLWSMISTRLSGTGLAAMTGRMQLLREIALVNREREALFEQVQARNDEYREIGRQYQVDLPELEPYADPPGEEVVWNDYVSMRSESRKLRRFRRRIARFMEDNQREMGLVENRLLIYHQTPRGLPLHAEDCMYVGKYGTRTDPETGTKTEFHTGVDLIAASGKEILATAPGKVIEVRNEGETGYGQFIRVHHGQGLTTLYAHNSENFVKEGDLVRRGQVIALVGDTGRTVGAHLHYEVRFGPEYDDSWRKLKPENPTEYLKNERGEHTCEI